MPDRRHGTLSENLVEIVGARGDGWRRKLVLAAIDAEALILRPRDGLRLLSTRSPKPLLISQYQSSETMAGPTPAVAARRALRNPGMSYRRL